MRTRNPGTIMLLGGLVTVLAAGSFASAQVPNPPTPTNPADPAVPPEPTATSPVQVPGPTAPDAGLPRTPGTSPANSPSGLVPSTPGAANFGPGPANGFFTETAPASGLGASLADAPSFFPNVLGDQGSFLGTDPIAIRQLLPGNGVPIPPPLPPPGQPPLPPRPGAPQPAGPNRFAPAIFPRARNFKIGENQSPRPVDRIYFNFNFFDGVNTAQYASLNVPLNNLKLYRQVIGFEKTFLDGRASWQFRLPFNQLTAQGPFVDRGLGGNTASIGDLAFILKYVLAEDRATGRLLSTGLLVNAPTGTDAFAGARYLRNVHLTTLQPYVGFILPKGDFFVQGFSSIDVPVNRSDVTMLYNDIAMGYYLYRAKAPDRFVSAFVPSFEAHVNTPLNHRDYLDPFDAVGTPDIVNLTFGGNFFLRERGLLAVGLVEPVTGPRPFNYEFFVQFNLRF